MDTTVTEDNLERPGGYLEAFRVQARIIGKIMIREYFVRYQKNPIGYAWAVVEPCLHVVMWWLLLTFIKNTNAQLGMPPILVVCTGFVPMFLFRGVSNYVYRCVRSAPAMVKYPLVSHIDYLIAKFIMEGLAMIGVGILVFTVLITAGLAPLPRDPLGLFPPCFALLWMGLGFGSLFAFLAPLSVFFKISFVVIMRIFYFSSGIFFLGNKLPSGFLRYVLWNPIFHSVELFREAYFYNFHNAYVTIWYPLGLGSVLFLGGLILERTIYRPRRLRRIYIYR